MWSNGNFIHAMTERHVYGNTSILGNILFFWNDKSPYWYLETRFFFLNDDVIRLFRPVQILISCTLSKGRETRIRFHATLINILFNFETKLDALSPGPFKNNN